MLVCLPCAAGWLAVGVAAYAGLWVIEDATPWDMNRALRSLPTVQPRVPYRISCGCRSNLTCYYVKAMVQLCFNNHLKAALHLVLMLLYHHQEHMERLQQNVDERSAAAARATAEASAADTAALQQQLREVKEALAERERELAQARAALASADAARADAFQALQAETMMLRTRLGELLQIDEKYQQVLLENRELYNTVQDLRGNIRVYCRWGAWQRECVCVLRWFSKGCRIGCPCAFGC